MGIRAFEIPHFPSHKRDAAAVRCIMQQLALADTLHGF